VQDEIADAVVKTLKLSLINDDPSEATAAPSNAAYLLFLQARALRHGLRDRKQAETIVSYLRQAVSLDPLFAPAWAELARALVYQSNNGYDSPDKVRADAHHAAEQALMHGQNLAIAHLSRGIVCFYLDWDWACADHAYRKALELDPRSPDIFVFLSGIPIVHGKIDEARTLLERAVELDPLDERYYQWLGDMAFYLRQFSEAEAEYRKSLAIHPGYDGISARLGAVEMSRGNLQAALELMERETDEESREWGLSLIYHELRRKTDADSALAELERRHGGDSAIDIAEIHAFRGEIDQAFSWLDRAFRQRADGIYAIKTDPWLQNLLPDSRFNALLKKMNLPQ
jgi:tetratricopeptide (TPR) repeat protein